jgi:hypothetical protein
MVMPMLVAPSRRRSALTLRGVSGAADGGQVDPGTTPGEQQQVGPYLLLWPPLVKRTAPSCRRRGKLFDAP